MCARSRPAGWRHIHHLTGRVGLLLAGAVVVALAVAWFIHRHRSATKEREPVDCLARR